MESRDKRMKTAVLEDRAKKEAIRAHTQAETLAMRDRLNLDHPRFPHHALIAAAGRSYMMLQTSGRLCDGHCLLVPHQCVPSMVAADEDTLEEIRNFKKCLIRMFDATDQECVFIELAMGLDKVPHAFVECVPLRRGVAANAPMYFKKALQECEDEFEQQNRPVIDTRGARHLSQKIPRGMPYFAVDFGLKGGFAHVIENERKFPKSFGSDILAGLLHVHSDIVARERSSITVERQLAEAFKASYDPFDWTKALT